jgi:hypothetical protein
MRFASCAQTIIEDFQNEIATIAGLRGHIEGLAKGCASALDVTLFARATRIGIEGSAVESCQRHVLSKTRRCRRLDMLPSCRIHPCFCGLRVATNASRTVNRSDSTQNLPSEDRATKRSLDRGRNDLPPDTIFLARFRQTRSDRAGALPEASKNSGARDVRRRDVDCRTSAPRKRDVGAPQEKWGALVRPTAPQRVPGQGSS